MAARKLGANDPEKAQTPSIDSKSRNVVYTGHNAYMMSVARVCREALKFTDVVLACPDGKVAAHRLVLAAASTTLRTAFKEMPLEAEGGSEYVIVVPEVRMHVVASLVDFLYTGKLMLSRSNSRDLQLLVKLLGIDPDNVRVEALEEASKKRLLQTHLTTSMGLTLKQGRDCTTQVASEGSGCADGKPSPAPPAENVNGKVSRGTKRRASQESSNGNGKEARAAKTTACSQASTAAVSPAPPVGLGTDKATGSAKTKGRPDRPNRPSSKGDSSSGTEPLPSGYHDMSNVETWVCAICHLYDPATLEGENSGDTTEWIGCDCNRWYHKLCTGLSVVDESFCCEQVKLDCLPPSPKK